jgi:hypothetical protein
MRYPINMTIAYFKDSGEAIGNADSYGIPTSNTFFPYQMWGVSFKFFFLLEKNTDPNDDTKWEYVNHSKIRDIVTNNKTVLVDSSYNVIHFAKEQGSGRKRSQQNDPEQYGDSEMLSATFNLVFANGADEFINVDLNKGDTLRLRLIFMDPDNFATYGRHARISIGKVAYDQFPDRYISQAALKYNYTPYFELTDINLVTESEEVLTSAPNDVNVFTVNNDTLVFDDEYTYFFINSASFSPSGSTQNFYTPIIDDLSIKPLDIMRIGKFKSRKSQYFTVVDAKVSLPDGATNENTLQLGNLPAADPNRGVAGIITEPNRSWQIGAGGGTVDKNTIIIPSNYNPSAYSFFERVSETPSRKFTITDVSPTEYKSLLEKTFTITGFSIQHVKTDVYDNAQIDYPSVEISVEEEVPNSNSGAGAVTFYSDILSWGGGINCKFVASDPTFGGVMIVKLDRPVPAWMQTVSRDFAILRPKPDETSVIVNHLKKDGNVSQAILIPEDASTTIKENVGNIFKALNVDLENTNDTQINM